MADKVIHVNVTATKSQKVNVSAGNVQNQITATPDSSQYYSNLAKNWATGTGLILNEDYSSKHYANASKVSAEQAKNYADATQETYNNVIDYSVEAMDNIEVTKNSAISDISESGHKAVTDIETEKQNTITEIQDITINNKEEIEKLSNQEQNKIVSLGIESRANKDLSNLSAIGENKFNTILSNKITNCITEIPQRIKLELTDNGLTLKKDSVVNIATGVNSFEEYTIPADVTAQCLFTGSYTDISVIYLKDKNQLRFCPVNVVNSGSTDADEGITNHIWYDTTTGLIKYFNDTTTTPYSTQCSLPICSASNVGTETVSFSKINQVFNGFGYIGSTVWVDKGVKGLIPNKFNEDGSFKNIEFTTSKVITYERNLTGNNIPVFVRNNHTIAISTGLLYDKMNNIIATGGYYQVATVDMSSGVISNFQPKLPFRAVDYNDYINTPHITESYVNGTSGYNIYSNKYCEQWGQVTSSGTITFLKSFKDKNYSLIITPNTSTGWGQGIPLNQMGWTAKTATGFTTTADVNCTKEWRACGYIA